MIEGLHVEVAIERERFGATGSCLVQGVLRLDVGLHPRGRRRPICFHSASE